MKIGVRGSKLALEYASRAAALINNAEIVTVTTEAEINPDTPILEMGGKGVFCKAIEQKLIDKEIDIAVHSLKDLTRDSDDVLEISAVLKRNDPRDCVIGNPDKPGAKIGTGSPRRIAQLKKLYPQAEIVPIRGNIDTRISKVESGQYDAIVLAVAGLEALGLQDKITKTFTIREMFPAVGQGVIALQTRKKSSASNLLSTSSDPDTYKCAMAERKMLEVINGDCHTAVGCISSIVGDYLMMEAHNFETDKYSEVIGKKENYIELGEQLGTKLI
jgi:hydroxymethylbilane synthase|tara:strand:+ start:2105 stop:2926 length:822 start_codon:yes stop_codon:yes gene_type:complete